MNCLVIYQAKYILSFKKIKMSINELVYNKTDNENQDANFTGVKSLIEKSNFINNGVIFFKKDKFEPLPFMDYSLFQESYGNFFFHYAPGPSVVISSAAPHLFKSSKLERNF